MERIRLDVQVAVHFAFYPIDVTTVAYVARVVTGYRSHPVILPEHFT